jgi:pimeloyl-ACP methyl ester carboxylesterase
MKPLLTLIACAAMPAAAVAQEVVEISGATCPTTPILDCPDANCPSERVINPGTVVEMETRRTYFLDYPCDLKPGEQVTVVLSLHGGGSYGNWQRHYFPLYDYKDEYRLVIATPNSPIRVWTDVDDAYLQNIVDHVIAEIGAANIRAFWLAGHSQGGATSRRLVCTEYFAGKVDGFLSLSGGRVGGNPGRAPNFGLGGGQASPPVAAGGGAALTSAAAALGTLPGCDFSHIFTVGEREMDEAGLPEASAWAEKYGCGPRQGPVAVVDTKAGYVYDSSRQDPPNPAWGLPPAPGTAEIYTYPDCAGGRVVADAVRLEKGHTEGLEPMITEELVRLMVGAPGGKIRQGAN